ncbi:MAG: sugar phosphate nucleotidyltransferase [Spirochaetes bacterium]|nr:sugar phosphate nucleotidyltransferase [Spirochaetota bacterium]
MNILDLLVNKNTNIIDAMKILDKTAKKILFVVDENNKLIGSLTDGDIRRYILKTGSLDGEVKDVCNKNTFKVKLGYDKKEIVEEAISKEIKYVPVISDNDTIVEILILEESKIDSKLAIFKELKIPVVIMAGGFGTRLEPFTKILPKPLIPIGDKTILEIIMGKFYEYGILDFYLSVNYKSYIIKSYFSEINLPFNITYLQEEKPLGTAGSLYLLKGKIKSDYFILTNCDIIIDIDYYDLCDFHYKNNNHITIVVSAKNYKIPYGVCEIKDGLLYEIKEKPEMNFLINTGMYVINSNVLNIIPENEFFHATDLINVSKRNNYKIGVYPISEDSWIDVGQWEEYKKVIERFKL